MSPSASQGIDEPEWLTRKRRIDPRLDALGWKRVASAKAGTGPCRVEEMPTSHGPADYVLALDGQVVAIIEAKKLSVGPQNVLTQAERYARGLDAGRFDFDGCKVPFLYSTNGEVIWFHDVRSKLNRSRRIADFHSPDALRELLVRNFDDACESLLALPQTSTRLRSYQLAANAAVENAIAERKRHMLVAMATGTGKTFTMVNQVYRLMKSGVARRVLFLVDRRALAAQAVRAFASFEAEPNQKFDKLYPVYSSRFQREDFGDEEKFDPQLIQQHQLEHPKPSDTFVYVATIQRMAINILGRDAVPGLPGNSDEGIEDDAGRLDIPIHAFDVVIADECHRGYTASEQSVWRDTLNHLDAIKLGLTATPAQHTSAYFEHKVFEYPYEQAVREGHLVDYDVVTVKSDVRLQGVFLREGEEVERVDTTSGLKQLDLLEDERHFETSELESKVTAPESNRKILEEVKKYALEHEARYGRFPKTLIFAVNDLPHTSHADQLVLLARDVLGRGEAFVDKITGKVDRPLQRIREFRNRREPALVVTVDLLSTGVDIPDLEFIVFLRPVRSRILFEQMLGRGTRQGEQCKDKSHFTVFDCFDGSLLAYFKNATGITAEPIDRGSRTIVEIIEDVWNNRDRDYNVKCLVKRLQRIDKELAAEGRESFAAHLPDGDVAAYARGLGKALERDFTGTMKTLRDPSVQHLLVHYPRPTRDFFVATHASDVVTSAWLVRDGKGNEYKPEDYLAAFERFVRENPEHIDAIRVLLDRPKEWSTEALVELRTKLAKAEQRFTKDNLERAHEAHYHKALVDLISMVKHAADRSKPLLTAPERVERAFRQLSAGESFTAEQQAWLGRIREHLIQNLSIESEDFDLVPVLEQAGGLGAARRVFGKQLPTLLRRLNELVAA